MKARAEKRKLITATFGFLIGIHETAFHTKRIKIPMVYLEGAVVLRTMLLLDIERLRVSTEQEQVKKVERLTNEVNSILVPG